jgi:hypothetical protein
MNGLAAGVMTCPLNSVEMLPLYQDSWFSSRFNDDRILPGFHLEGVEVGRQVTVFKIDAGTGEWLGLLGCLSTRTPVRRRNQDEIRAVATR